MNNIFVLFSFSSGVLFQQMQTYRQLERKSSQEDSWDFLLISECAIIRRFVMIILI